MHRGPLDGRTLALAVTGSIAAYKAAHLARLCVKAGARVLPVMSSSARQFLGPLSLAAICGEPVAIDMWDPSFAGEMHVRLAERADLVAVVPATADFLARLATGRADDLVAALALCARGPVLIAPAMHPRMWTHPATQRNVRTLLEDGRVSRIGPVVGDVASGDAGIGRMAEPEEIFHAILAALSPKGARDRDLAGVRLVVTAGPTLEDLDPVRFLGNRSSGKMGFAVAEQAARRGAEVTLIAGPVERATPPGVKQRIDVRGALAMRDALWAAAGEDLARIDALVMTAAVADYRPAEVQATKIKKDSATTSLGLVKNPDLLAEIGARRAGAPRPLLVGFALETKGGDPLADYAKKKLLTKRVDLIVANHADEALSSDSNRALLVSAAGAEPLEVMPKHALADVILDRIKARLG